MLAWVFPLLGNVGVISIFDIFKVGIGPSSSHTVGPMRAALRFAGHVGAQIEDGAEISHLRVTLYGSLAWTAQGHGTDRAIALGLCGEDPETVQPEVVESIIERMHQQGVVKICGQSLRYQPQHDLILDRDTLPPAHPNTLQFEALDTQENVLLKQRYCSVGGGFIVPEDSVTTTSYASPELPYDFISGKELLAWTETTGKSIAELVRANEEALQTGTPAERRAEVNRKLDHIAHVMLASIQNGFKRSCASLLPGKLQVRRRAPSLRRRLLERMATPTHSLMDWVSLFAMAVNEENASFGRVVTAPTNGAAGVVPAVLRYWRDFCSPYRAQNPEKHLELQRDFLLTAGALGALFKLNASISGAEVGCQGEVGVASSMAAGGLASILGGSPRQVEAAAESAMEHHLGMTCDPIGGLVQIPCIERNAFGAIKAINAASLALCGNGVQHVTLDQVIRTMKETGRDMNARYKETSQGGLALNYPEC